MTLWDQIQQSAAAIARAIAPRSPRIGIVLGSGLHRFGDVLDDAVSLPYPEIPGFASSTVAGHPGRLVAGYSAGKPVLVMQGRLHRYEGHALESVVLPLRAMIAVGCRVVIITNAAGGIREDLAVGDLVLLTDHINLSGANPLIGPNDERLGPRFPDLNAAYDPELRLLAYAQASEEGLELKEGVYCAVSGPSYETPAEVQMLRELGADLVGMSTVHEVIVARQMGARVLGISCVSNMAAGLGGRLDHREVQLAGERATPLFAALLSRLVAVIKE